MRYRVTYRKRFNREGGEADFPQKSLNLPDGLVIDAAFIERFEPDNLHGEEEMDEDDDFLSLGSEVWEYDVTPGRDQEFKDAVAITGAALEIDPIEEST